MNRDKLEDYSWDGRYDYLHRMQERNIGKYFSELLEDLKL